MKKSVKSQTSPLRFPHTYGLAFGTAPSVTSREEEGSDVWSRQIHLLTDTFPQRTSRDHVPGWRIGFFRFYIHSPYIAASCNSLTLALFQVCVRVSFWGTGLYCRLFRGNWGVGGGFDAIITGIG